MRSGGSFQPGVCPLFGVSILQLLITPWVSPNILFFQQYFTYIVLSYVLAVNFLPGISSNLVEIRIIPSLDTEQKMSLEV
jgi:hypothetical protein